VEVQKVASHWFHFQSPEFCAEGIHALIMHCDKGMNLEGDHEEKYVTVLFSHEKCYSEEAAVE
jgi:hypothetical protein